MVASTDIKFFVHTNGGAPQLQNAYGSMINVLDACLVNGINIGTVSSLTASGTTATALFSASHNLMQYQVIKITGAAQSEFNGEHRILTVPNAQSVTFELAVAPSVSTATGTITASLAPLGWEKPFSSSNPNGGGKAAYRSTNLLLPSRPFLRVVDELDPAYTATYAKYAKVGIVEDMTDIDTMLGVQAPFDNAAPNKNWVGTGSGEYVYNGWAKWYYAKDSREYNTSTSVADSFAATNGNRNWLVVGNEDYLYIVPSMAANQHGVPYGFGSFSSLLTIDNSNTFLLSSLRYMTAGTTSQGRAAQHVALTSDNLNTLTLFKNYKQADNYATAFITSLKLNSTSAAVHYSGVNNDIATSVDLGAVVLSSAVIREGSAIRGVMPGVSLLHQAKPYSDLSTLLRDNEMYIAKDIHCGSVNDAASVQLWGQIVFDL